MTTIELRGVWYRYPGMNGWALREVSTKFSSGKLTLISGHNGSGKTTLLKLGALLYRPMRGVVMVDGRSFWSLDDSERTGIRRRVSYLHEKPILLSGSVLENIAYPFRIRGIGWEAAAERAQEIMRELELLELAGRSARGLSAGQAQLVALARVLAAGPELLFLDEPFAHLDSRRLELVGRALHSRMKRGMGIVIASHARGELPEGLRPEEVIVLEEGRVASILGS